MTQSLPPGQGPIDPRGAFQTSSPMPFPPMMPMPMMPPPRPKSRAALWIIIVLLLLALIGSVLVNLVQLAVTAAGSMGEVRQTTISGDGADRVAVVPVSGLIDSSSQQSLDTVLKEV